MTNYKVHFNHGNPRQVSASSVTIDSGFFMFHVKSKLVASYPAQNVQAVEEVTIEA